MEEENVTKEKQQLTDGGMLVTVRKWLVGGEGEGVNTYHVFIS